MNICVGRIEGKGFEKFAVSKMFISNSQKYYHTMNSFTAKSFCRNGKKKKAYLCRKKWLLQYEDIRSKKKRPFHRVRMKFPTFFFNFCHNFEINDGSHDEEKKLGKIDIILELQRHLTRYEYTLLKLDVNHNTNIFFLSTPKL